MKVISHFLLNITRYKLKGSGSVGTAVAPKFEVVKGPRFESQTKIKMRCF
jgi:hypothetical protein